MRKKSACARLARGFVGAARAVGRLAGSVAAMVLRAAALGGAIAGVSIAATGGMTTGAASVSALTEVSAAGPAPAGELFEARSAWIGGKKSNKSARLRCVESREDEAEFGLAE